jgi:uncharacterized glyoxalase superfamily protein PhnB
VTLGVKDLKKSFVFYKDILGFPSDKGIEGDIAFFQLNHMWLGLYPKNLLAKDAKVENTSGSFSGITLAHNLKTIKEVDALFAYLKKSKVKISKMPEKTDWGGYSGYFCDPDGYLWEVAYNPFFWIE